MNRKQLRSYLLSLPGVEERETWGHPTFRVHDKIVASFPDEPGTVVIKASPDEQRALIAADADTFATAPRVGRYGWVSVRIAKANSEQVRELLDTAWQRTAPASLRRGAAR